MGHRGLCPTPFIVTVSLPFQETLTQVLSASRETISLPLCIKCYEHREMQTVGWGQ